MTYECAECRTSRSKSRTDSHHNAFINQRGYSAQTVLIKQYIKNVLKSGLRSIPSESKHELFKILHKSRGTALRELVISEGDSGVMIGSPNPQRVHQFAKLVGSDGRVLFVEPEPNNFNSLRKAGADYDYVDIVRLGAWSESGKQELLLGGESNPGDHKIPVENIEHDNDYRPENYNESIEIQVAPLDTILSENDVIPDYTEIMVNGAEFEILEGATDTLSSAEPTLLIKGHQLNTSTGEPMNKQIADHLRKYGYKTAVGASTRRTVGETDEWEKRAGDVYAWKN